MATRIAESLATGPGFWLHLDVDILDRETFPATDYPMGGGLNWEELGATLEPFLSSLHLIGASLACYNPQKDPGRVCGRTLVEAISAGFG